VAGTGDLTTDFAAAFTTTLAGNFTSALAANTFVFGGNFGLRAIAAAFFAGLAAFTGFATSSLADDLAGLFANLIAGLPETFAAGTLFLADLLPLESNALTGLDALTEAPFFPLDGFTRDGLLDDDLATWTPCSFHRAYVEFNPYVPARCGEIDRTVFDITEMGWCQ
jgi:hypothetical protein